MAPSPLEVLLYSGIGFVVAAIYSYGDGNDILHFEHHTVPDSLCARRLDHIHSSARAKILSDRQGTRGDTADIVRGHCGNPLSRHPDTRNIRTASDSQKTADATPILDTRSGVGVYPDVGMPQRGGMVAMLKPFFRAHTYTEYWYALGVMFLVGGLAYLIVIPLSRLILRLVRSLDYRLVSLGTLGILIPLVLLFGGTAGLLLLVVSTAIGLIPVLFGSRRLNLMGVLLVPITLNMAGIGPRLMQAIGVL